MDQFLDNVKELPGVVRIISNEEYNSIGYPRYEESPYVLGQYIIIPDIDTYLKVDAGSGSPKREARSPAHSHGYLPDHPRMYPALVVSGAGILKGQRIGLVRNHDVAPTIAHLLDLSMKNLEGRVLREAMKK